MGIFVKLDIVPARIDSEEWIRVYNECLKLVEAYPFLDKHIDTTTYDCTWCFVNKTEERPIPYLDNNIGFKILGDMITLKTAESFEVIRDINYYCSFKESRVPTEDVLFVLLSQENIEYENLTNGTTRIFGAKTQGYDYHKYILAIACLIESRFPKYAVVYGDISKGQLENAVEWANTVLDKPIQISNRADNEILFERITQVIKDPADVLDIFMRTTLNDYDCDLGKFVMKNFDEQTIIKYNSKQFIDIQIGTYGFSNSLEEYFNMGFGLKGLCEIFKTYIVELDKITKFIESVLGLGMHIDKSQERLERIESANALKFESNNPSSKKPDTVYSLLMKTMLMLQGSKNNQSTTFISLTEITETLKLFWGEVCNVDEIINNYFENINKDSEMSLFDEITKMYEENDKENDKENDEIIQYDIEHVDDLILWKPELSLAPVMEKFLKGIRDFTDKYISENIISLNSIFEKDKKTKMQYIINKNKFFYISKNSWNYIESILEDKNAFSKISILLVIKVEEITINHGIKNILNNINLFEKYIL